MRRFSRTHDVGISSSQAAVDAGAANARSRLAHAIGTPILLNSFPPPVESPPVLTKCADNINDLRFLADLPYEYLHGLEVNTDQGLRWQQSLSIAILPPSGRSAALNASSAELSSNLERLSSGKRINQASDDAAGLAVSSTLNATARIHTRRHATSTTASAS